MKKFILLLLPILFVSAAYGQESKPPKLRIQNGFLSDKYEMGDKTAPAKEVALHLKKYEPDAYIKWKAADRAEISALVWSLVGLGGIIVGVTASDNKSALAGYSVAVGAETISRPRRRVR